ncbi:MAG: coenzyme F420-0:L-glutamate ligase [Microlunatus sp.]|nr:coenzyme F420-0:L-glutamate ligase [Microlunatus sp.]
MIEVSVLPGIGEISTGSDLVEVIGTAADDQGGLLDGDILVVTSKIVSKAEGRYAGAENRQAVIDAETVRTVARRQSLGIVETHHGLTQAGAGVDNSNVEPGRILLLPADSDRSAEQLRAGLAARFGVRIGVVVSDTAGRAWRIGQTDHAIGAAGVRVLDRYAGRQDGYGNELHVTAIAVADELAAAADLAKTKLGGTPVAIIRGAAEHVVEPGPAARDVLRTGEEDLFYRGAREAVIGALLAAVGRADRYEQVVRLWDRDELYAAITDGLELTEPESIMIKRMIITAQPLWPPPQP